MRNQKVIQWELRLKGIFDEIDVLLEEQYEGALRLHPARANRNTTSSPDMDGLFNIGASYSTGLNSEFGPGYVVEIRLSTLQTIPNDLKDELCVIVKKMLLEKLPVVFPGKEMFVEQEGHHLRIFGDLSFD